MEPKLRAFLEKKLIEYNQPEFIKDDPVCVPHRFSKKQDIEISGLFAALFAWGNRKTIINKSLELMSLMDNAPHDFILNHTDADLKKLLHFKHRTFNATDLLYFVAFFKSYYSRHSSLETAFTQSMHRSDVNTENALIGFYKSFFSLEEIPERTRKHISTPAKNSACKRLNMFLRWMVRSDDQGVDFGIWKRIRPDQLVCPLDVHVTRVAAKFGLIKSSKTNWQTAVELTGCLKTLDPRDPVKYDFALFGLGIMEKF
ncbi:MAG TPA: TIGR02757 family protein [Parasegetibacter sp.]